MFLIKTSKKGCQIEKPFMKMGHFCKLGHIEIDYFGRESLRKSQMAHSENGSPPQKSTLEKGHFENRSLRAISETGHGQFENSSLRKLFTSDMVNFEIDHIKNASLRNGSFRKWALP